MSPALDEYRSNRRVGRWPCPRRLPARAGLSHPGRTAITHGRRPKRCGALQLRLVCRGANALAGSSGSCCRSGLYRCPQCPQASHVPAGSSGSCCRSEPCHCLRFHALAHVTPPCWCRSSSMPPAPDRACIGVDTIEGWHRFATLRKGGVLHAVSMAAGLALYDMKRETTSVD
jgi:hypothetical protein